MPAGARSGGRARGDPARRRHLGGRAAHRAGRRARRPGRRAPVTSVELPGGGRLTLLEPYPRAGSSPTGRGNRLWRAAVQRPAPARAAPACATAGPIAYGYLDRQLPAGGLPDGLRHPAGQRRDAQCRTAVQPPSWSPGLVAHRGRRRGGHAAHRGVVAGGGRGAAARAVRGAGGRPRGWSTPPAPSGGRVVAVGTTVTRALESAVVGRRDGARRGEAGWTDRVVSRDGPAAGGERPGHRLARPARPRTCCSSRRWPGQELTQRAYDAAVGAGYLWHEFGDSALLLP